MRVSLKFLFAALLVFPRASQGQETLTLLSIRNGESIPIRSSTWMTSSCVPLYIGFEGIDLLEGPRGISLRFEPGKILSTRDNCAKQVDGGTVFADAAGITERSEGILTFRVRLKTKEGSKQVTYRYRLIVFPSNAQN